ncbi:MAG: hypothetical protein R3305_00625 [Gammaproteobacteria bacterium]|nr:hypothetical protein [Gammaproteobacteria bacterium]
MHTILAKFRHCWPVPGVRKLFIATSAGLASAALTWAAHAYPLDGVADSGIRRLEGYANAQQRPTGAKLSRGALLSADDIELRLVGVDVEDFDARPEDPELKALLDGIFRDRDPSYSLVVVDISDPDDIRWAGLRPDTRQNVGSVGKIITMAGLFHELRRAFPNIEDRRRILATTKVRAGNWVNGDSHDVPRFDPETGYNTFARLNPDDEFYLSEWLDHAISASANGAASVVWREAMLIRHFGNRYPVPADEAAAFFRDTPKARLSELSLAISNEPLIAAGLNTQNIRQGSFWTGTGKNYVPGTSSYATPRELSRFMFRLEQGRHVDEWSSLEMKKYMYITKRRYRYVYAPELATSATFFKSGSLYSCKAEEGFRCGKYMGNDRNFMNSVVTVEYPAGADEPELVYSVSLISNVLKFNSAWDHSRFAAAIHEGLLSGAVRVRDSASANELAEAGRSD